MSHELPSAGWYPDPENPAGQRYWDGAAWTENRVDYATAPQPSLANASGKKRLGGIKLFLIVFAAIIAAVVLLVVGCAALVVDGVDEAVDESNKHAITKSQYDSIEDGMTRAEVEDALGSQDFDQKGVPDSSCIYYNETDELLGRYFQFCFDDNKLSSKSAY